VWQPPGHGGVDWPRWLRSAPVLTHRSCRRLPHPSSFTHHGCLKTSSHLPPVAYFAMILAETRTERFIHPAPTLAAPARKPPHLWSTPRHLQTPNTGPLSSSAPSPWPWLARTVAHSTVWIEGRSPLMKRSRTRRRTLTQSTGIRPEGPQPQQWLLLWTGPGLLELRCRLP
jgi:hypothetical protein